MSGYLVLAGVSAGGVLLFVAAMFARSLLAPQAPGHAKESTYESGVDPVAGGWAQTHVRFMSFAFLYLVFAVDSAFLFPWALVLHDTSINRASLVEMGIFIAVILVGLVHAARRGLLRWTTDN
ncbi:MAG: NADH-quinone oxidoreductase subunit A [Actinomycetota bacterium]|nr:NADH-quinone oxidoreductase subunit A [Actinomycetota bacterium]